MIQSRCNFIISSFPNSEEKQNHLLSHIERIKEVGGYVTLITHFDCDVMIKDAVDFYLYNSNNEVSYKDSDLLQPILLGKATNFPSVNWVSFCDDNGDVVYGDYKAWVGYSPSIISLFIPALAMSFSGQFDYVVYMESDFIFPDNFDDKVNSICSQLENEGNDSLLVNGLEFSTPWCLLGPHESSHHCRPNRGAHRSGPLSHQSLLRKNGLCARSSGGKARAFRSSHLRPNHSRNPGRSRLPPDRKRRQHVSSSGVSN